MASYLDTVGPLSRSFRTVTTCVALFLLFQFATLYLSWPKQIWLGGVSVLIALALNHRSKSIAMTIALMLLSLVTTVRYGWWRIHMILDFFTDESNHRITISAVLMMILFSAEAYTMLIMVLGYMQTVAPLGRKPISLPADPSLWPHVDVLIPTYNEPLSLVRYTALAAVYLDYPPDKLHIYILDDGTREDFRLFCKEADIGYIVRKEHNDAKAGNINHALTQMNSSLVAIFDCDHVPTRSFLETTVGWFLADEKLAILQTPHFFYSPDPFERNLLQYKTIPNEGELFYGVIQDGNDLWNATFFCGSCAVIRRTALDEVGGIATQTVTEDAHTSLRIQRRGWDTAYINIPQAAGLATGTLSAHVGQRIRWARGMIQILRTENPLFASGMKLTQRLCYFNAMLHFMYSVPRLVFLTAPLAYLLFRWTILPGYWLAILAYAMPHLVISNLTNSRVQGKHRHSFWNEIYETVLAPYILAPTLLALINPKLGKFNVTDKDSTLKETVFDRHIAAPTICLLTLNLLGVCMVPYRLLVTDPTHPGAVLSNMVWILFNMVILGVAAAVANEHQQRRTTVRIPTDIAIHLRGDDGILVSAMTSDISVGGVSIPVTDGMKLVVGSHLHVSFPEQTGDMEIHAAVIGQEGPVLRLKFDKLTIEEEETLTRAIYSRADAWITQPGAMEEDRPLISLARVVRLSFTGFHQVARGLLPRKKSVALIVLAAVLFASPLRGAQKQVTSVPATPDRTETTATDKITLKDMGVEDAIRMNGPHSYYSVGFVLSQSKVPRTSRLNLSYHFSSAILSHSGSINVMVNNIAIGMVTAPEMPQEGGQFGFVSLPIPAELLVRNNELTFEFKGSAVLQAENQAETATLAMIGASSTVLVAGDTLPLTLDLSLLPLPLFDRELQTTTTIPFVFLSAPTSETLEAAAVVASWLGVQVNSKPIRFSVVIGTIPSGNVVVLANKPEALLNSLQVPPRGASLNIRINPSDPDGTALILAGENDEQLLMAARSLSQMAINPASSSETVASLGSTASITELAMPLAREPDDAPRWMTTDSQPRPWTDESHPTLGTGGSKPGPIYFRLPPDLYYGETQNLSLKLSYRLNALPIAPGSALRVYLNGSLVNEVPLTQNSNQTQRNRAMLVPVEKMRPFSNTMLINFDMIPLNQKSGGHDTVLSLPGEVSSSSSIDLRKLENWAAMPNLELFANAGFPFTRIADLGETVVVMPQSPSPEEIALLLSLVSHFGSQTGYPCLRVEIAGPDAVMRNDRDYLILGNVNNQPAYGALQKFLPITLDANGLHLTQASNPWNRITEIWGRIHGQIMQQSLPKNTKGLPQFVIEEIQNPTFAGRSIVVVASQNDDAIARFETVFPERSQSSDIAQSVSVLGSARFLSYDFPSSTYHVGNISKYALMRIWLTRHSWLLFLTVTGFCLLLAGWARDYLGFVAKSRLQAAEKTL